MATKISGVEYSFASIKIGLDGPEPDYFEGIKSINFNDGVDVGKARSRSGKLRATTQGTYDADGDIEFDSLESAQLFIDYLGRNGLGWTQQYFHLFLSYAKDDGPIITRELQGCRALKAEDGGSSDSNDPIMTKFTLHITEVIRGGVKAVV
jgi:hypothetical protein